MYSTQQTLRPASNSNSSSKDTKDTDDSAPHLACLGEHLQPPTGHEQDQEEMMSSDYHSEEVELEDLKAFERRMEELADGNRPRPIRWPLVLGTIFACTAISACHWVEDVRESESLVLRTLSSRGALAISLATLVVMVLYGLKRATRRYPSDSVENTRDLLGVFQLHCDNDGRLVQVTPISRETTTTRTTSAHSRSSHFPQ